MAKYNKTFELSIDDIDRIEDALRASKLILSQKTACDDADVEAREIHELLGRLHNLKNFYRPNKGTYIGG